MVKIHVGARVADVITYKHLILNKVYIAASNVDLLYVTHVTCKLNVHLSQAQITSDFLNNTICYYD